MASDCFFHVHAATILSEPFCTRLVWLPRRQKEAARDFEGHRAKAVKEINEALAELRLALKADKE
jgi:G:T-mismatch repair DNA endonuclease (very short patch repair protein)